VLGAIFIRNDAFHRVAGFLSPEHFGNAVHSRIFAAAAHLISTGAAANPVTLDGPVAKGAARDQVRKEMPMLPLVLSSDSHVFEPPDL
jgi:replicative DNA helicase